MNTKRNVLVGLFLMLLGVLIFFGGEYKMDAGAIIAYFWPTLFVIPVGIFLHWLYFSLLQQRGVGLLVPGGIIITTGIVCQISMVFENWSVTWPGFILAVAVGILELYWFGGRNKWLLIPIVILTTLSVLFFAVFSIGNLFNSQPVIAVILIAVGAWIALKGTKKESKY